MLAQQDGGFPAQFYVAFIDVIHLNRIIVSRAPWSHPWEVQEVSRIPEPPLEAVPHVDIGACGYAPVPIVGPPGGSCVILGVHEEIVGEPPCRSPFVARYE